MMITASWVLRNKRTGEFFETFSEVVAKTNHPDWEVFPILDWLVQVNKQAREGLPS